MTSEAPTAAIAKHTILTSEWPKDGSALDLSEALHLADQSTLSEEISSTLRSLSTAEKLSQHPILAVTGQLNSGKSSVVASFLSENGRARVPRGSSSSTGTHRFVYWVPQSWLDDAGYKSLLLELIATAHPHGVEFLDTSPEIAAEQYRSGRDKLDTLSIPLIAGDPQLDTLGAGLLDCPDIQTHDDKLSDDSAPTEAQNPRLDFLAAAARVCSAFLVVWNRSAIRDRLIAILLRSLRERMASAPLYLLINMIRPEEGQPRQTLEDSDVTRLLEQFSIHHDHVYGAFDFAIEDRDGKPGWRHYTPARLVEKFDQAEAPQFYPLEEGTQSEADLLSLSNSLDTAEIQLRKIQDHRSELEKLGNAAHTSITTWVAESEAEITQMHQGMLDTCHSMMMDETTGEPLQVMSSEFADALHESLVRTAPFALRLPLKLAKPFEKALDRSKKIISSLNVKKATKKKVGDLESQLKKNLKLGSLNLASSESIARRMQSQRWCPPELTVEEIEQAWDATFQKFQQHPIEDFDSEQLDDSSQEYWDGFNLMQKFTIGGKALLGTLGGLAALAGLGTAVVDGGATLFAATSVSHAISGGIALGVGAGGTAIAALGFQNSLLKDNTLPYLSRLFSIACDIFHLPRQIRDQPITVNYKSSNGSNTSHKLSPSDELPHFTAVTPLTENHLWNFTDSDATLTERRN